MLADVKLLAALGLPYFLITPLFPLARPGWADSAASKWHIALESPSRPASTTKLPRTTRWSPSRSPTRCARPSSRRRTSC